MTANAPRNIANVNFDDLAESYKKDANNVTREPAVHLVSLAPNISPSSLVLDVACGPGVVVEAIVSSYKDSLPGDIHAVDFSQGMVDQVKSQNWPNVTAAVMDGQNLDFPEGKFTHVFSTYGIFMFPDSQKGLTEARRVLQDGGWFGSASWKSVPWSGAAIRAWSRLKPDAEAVKWPMPERWTETEDVKKRLEDAGFKNVEAKYFDSYTVLKSCKFMVDMMRPFLKQILPPVGKLSDDELDKFCEYMADEMEKDEDVELKDGHAVAKSVSVMACGTK